MFNKKSVNIGFEKVRKEVKYAMFTGRVSGIIDSYNNKAIDAETVVSVIKELVKHLDNSEKKEG